MRVSDNFGVRFGNSGVVSPLCLCRLEAVTSTSAGVHCTVFPTFPIRWAIFFSFFFKLKQLKWGIFSFFFKHKRAENFFFETQAVSSYENPESMEFLRAEQFFLPPHRHPFSVFRVMHTDAGYVFLDGSEFGDKE